MSSLLNAFRRSGSQVESKEADPESSTERDARSALSLAIPGTIESRLRKAPKYQRTSLYPGELSLWGWPSRGGVIVLDDPTPPDFDYLKLDPLNPPLHRDADQDAEDAFCRDLLRLGATWWNSSQRRDFVVRLRQLDPDAIDAIDAGEEPLPTRRERRWIRVAWPANGSVCIAEYDTDIIGFQLDKDRRRVPDDAGRVALARNMDERCDLLLRIGGTLYASIDDYDGNKTFLKAWEEGEREGEVGPLVKTVNE